MRAGLTRHLFCWLCSAPLLLGSDVSTLPKCAKGDLTRSSEEGTAAQSIKVEFASRATAPLAVYWVDFDGDLRPIPEGMTPGGTLVQNTFPKHVYRFFLGRALVYEHVVSAKDADGRVVVEPCLHPMSSEGMTKLVLANMLNRDVAVYRVELDGSLTNILPKLAAQDFAKHSALPEDRLQFFAGGDWVMNYSVGVGESGKHIYIRNDPSLRATEFDALRLPESQLCDPKLSSGDWSCAQFIPKDECDRRVGLGYGFVEGESDEYPAGTVEDFKFDGQIKSVPVLATSYLRMNMTAELRSSLLSWYAERRGQQKSRASIVPGGFLNDGKTRMDFTKLSPALERKVQGEMSDVLTWWARRPLKFSMMHGVRVYRRGNMLVNHVDRKESHVISAVLQVDQRVDQDGGWPLEIRTPSRDCIEVYLQPGEMVLYEGARLKHGRPMRFRGDEFANVFVHFAPQDWDWPPPKYPDLDATQRRAEL